MLRKAFDHDGCYAFVHAEIGTTGLRVLLGKLAHYFQVLLRWLCKRLDECIAVRESSSGVSIASVGTKSRTPSRDGVLDFFLEDEEIHRAAR